MDPTALYRALGDEQRLRMVNLLWDGPLCVCHVQAILGEGQVKVSKQLGTLRRLGILSARRQGTWMIYELREPVAPLLRANLEALRADPAAHPGLQADLARRARELACLCADDGAGPAAVLAGARCGAAE